MAWYTVPCRPIDNGIVPAIINLPLVVDLAEVDRVGEQLVDMAARKWSAPNLPAGRKYAARRMDLILAHLSGDQPNIPQFEVSREDLSYERCMVLDDLEAATVGLVTDRRDASHPHALGLGGSDLVANALCGHLTLELREAQQHVER
jgi:hypothetical protein